MARRLVFPEPKRVVLEDFDPAPLGSGDVRVRMHWSLMSTGTENTAFNGIFAPDTHWGAYVNYPFLPGYSSTGEITEVGSAVEAVSVGDRVFHMWPHASELVIPAVAAFPLPQQLDLAAANWAALAGIAFVGVRRAAIAVAETTVIVGAGPVGQMAVRWAALNGSGRVIVIDPAEERLTLARAGGATGTIAKPVDAALDDVRAANDGKRAQVVIDATGRAASFAEALPLVANFGRMVILGDAGDPRQQHLTSDLIARGVTVVAAHGNYMPYEMGLMARAEAESAPIDDVLATRTLGWRAFSTMWFELVGQGRFPLDGLITHSFPAEQAAEGFALVNQRRAETMGIAFSW